MEQEQGQEQEITDNETESSEAVEPVDLGQLMSKFDSMNKMLLEQQAKQQSFVKLFNREMASLRHKGKRDPERQNTDASNLGLSMADIEARIADVSTAAYEAGRLEQALPSELRSEIGEELEELSPAEKRMMLRILGKAGNYYQSQQSLQANDTLQQQPRLKRRGHGTPPGHKTSGGVQVPRTKSEFLAMKPEDRKRLLGNPDWDPSKLV